MHPRVGITSKQREKKQTRYTLSRSRELLTCRDKKITHDSRPEHAHHKQAKKGLPARDIADCAMRVENPRRATAQYHTLLKGTHHPKVLPARGDQRCGATVLVKEIQAYQLKLASIASNLRSGSKTTCGAFLLVETFLQFALSFPFLCSPVRYVLLAQESRRKCRQTETYAHACWEYNSSGYCSYTGGESPPATSTVSGVVHEICWKKLRSTSSASQA